MNKSLDRELLFVVTALSIAGLLMLYSGGQTDLTKNMAQGLWIRQSVWLLIGVIAAVLSSRVSFRLLEWATPWLYGIGLLLLLVLLIGGGKGAGTALSSKSWLAIGRIRLGQPSEIAKVATILMLARWFALRRVPPTTLRGMLPAVMLAAIPAGLVILQPDLGSALVFVGILFSMLFWAGVPPSMLVLLASPGISLLLAFNTLLWSAWMVLLFILLLVWRPFLLESIIVYLANSAMGVIALVIWDKLKPSQRDRIYSFLDPEGTRSKAGYQAFHSLIAIGSGYWFGNGYTQGTQKRLGYIPELGTDFIFAVVGEELGFVGVVISLLLFFGLFMVLIRIAQRSSDPYASLIVAGSTGLLLTHVFENVGMTISIMPITGIPLPFFSHGGSFVLAVFLMVGFAFRAASESRSAGYLES